MSRLALLVLMIAGCTDTSSGIAASEVTCPTDSTLTYASFGEAFLSSNCLSCHAAKERPTLSSQAAVQQYRQAIIDQAVLTTNMPEDADLSTDERRLLGEWLACGAP